MNTSLILIISVFAVSSYLTQTDQNFWEKVRNQESILNMRHSSRSSTPFDLSAGAKDECPSLCLFSDILKPSEIENLGIECLN